jgi:LacI family transcriptional regulator
MAEAGLPCDGLLAGGDFSYASGEAAARGLLTGPQPPSAIIASNDQMALATLEVARSLGIAVPQELSLISFDNTPLVHFTQPPLTAVDQPIAATTSRAVELIIAAQRGEPPPASLTVVSATITERDSVAPPAGHRGA